MQTVVLAAGLGTRLFPVTEGRSKAMVPVLGRPLVERAMMPLVAHGLKDVILVVGPTDDEIRRHFSERTQLDLDVRYVVQEERRGMAHALGIAAPSLSEDFVVTACDSVVPPSHVAELLSAHRGSSAVLSLMDVPRDLISRSAAVDLDGAEIRRIIEKPSPEEAPSNTVSLPLYVLPHSLLGLLSDLKPSARGEVELQGAIQLLIDRGDRVVGVRTTSRVQVSNPDDLLNLNLNVLRSGDEPECVATDAVGRGTKLKAPLRIETGVTIGRNCVIGPNAYLESGCTIGSDVVVRNSVVLRGVGVPNGGVVEGQLLS